MAQRLFQHDARLRAVQARGGELLAHRGEQGRGGGQVHHHRAGRAGVQGLGQPRVVLGARQVHAHEVQQGGEAVELVGARALGAFHLVEAGADEGAVARVVQVVARHADDAAARGQRAVAEGLEQGGHQLAPGQVAGAAEQNEVETHGDQCNFV